MIQKYIPITYTSYTDELDEYGQPKVDNTEKECLMAISVTKHSPTDSPLYVDSEYTGITMDNELNDKCIVNYNKMKLKILYILKGRFNQVFMQRIE